MGMSLVMKHMVYSCLVNAVLAIHFIVRDLLAVVSSVIKVGMAFIAKHLRVPVGF